MGTCYSNENNLDNHSNSTLPKPEINKDISIKHINKINLNDFIVHKKLGEGGFASVFLVEHIQTKKFFAMKCLKKNELVIKNQILNTKNERLILELTSNPFIVDLHCAFQTKKCLFMLMDFVEAGELFFYMQKNKWSETEIAFIAAQIILAIEHLHLLNIIYRDLKPENIMLDRDGYIKLTDFGLSKFEECKTFCGTPEYFAPEIILNKKYNKSVDWWSLGIIIYELFVGRTPFYNKNNLVMYKSILYKPPNYSDKINPAAMSWVEKLLEKDPTKRLGFNNKDFDMIKKHSWFSQIDWESLKKKQLKSPIHINIKDITSYKYFDKTLINNKLSNLNLLTNDSNIFSKDTSGVKFSLEFDDFTYKRKSFENNININNIQ